MKTIDAINNKVTLPVNSSIDIQVLDNDIRSADGSPLDVTSIVFSGTHGECIITNEGTTITYTPNGDFYGIDTCIYTACDEKRRCDSAAVIINVTPVVANDDSVTTDINTPIDFFPLDNDIFTDGHPLVIAMIERNANDGDCVMVSPQMVVYIPNPNFSGMDSCEYTTCDDRGVCDTAFINITVVGTPCDEKEDRIITNSPTHMVTSSPSKLGDNSHPTKKPALSSPTAKPAMSEPSSHPTHLLTANPTNPPAISNPTLRPTEKPTTPAPTKHPFTSAPSMAPSPCARRYFFFASGVCTNAFDQCRRAARLIQACLSLECRASAVQFSATGPTRNPDGRKKSLGMIQQSPGSLDLPARDTGCR